VPRELWFSEDDWYPRHTKGGPRFRFGFWLLGTNTGDAFALFALHAEPSKSPQGTVIAELALDWFVGYEATGVVESDARERWHQFRRTDAASLRAAYDKQFGAGAFDRNYGEQSILPDR